MSTITGGKVTNPYTGKTVSWKPAGPVADEYAFYTRSGSDAYVCLGVIGNKAHLRAKPAGDHTPWSTHTAIIGGKTVWPKAGWVYAIDGRVPDPAAFESWFLGRLRAGAYPWVKYFNINNRHWNRKAVRGGKPFAYAVASADGHLHISFMPTYEYADSSILADYEAHRTGKPAPATPPKKTRPAPGPALAFPLPHGYYFGPKTGGNESVSGYYGRSFRGHPDHWWLQQWAAQLGKRGWSVGKGRTYLHRWGNDGRYGPEYEALIVAFQRDQGLDDDALLGVLTWNAAYHNPVT